MQNISITITGASLTPEWETLEKAIAQMTCKQGKLTRIRKQCDCDYRGSGAYEVDFSPIQGDLIKVQLVVSNR